MTTITLSTNRRFTIDYDPEAPFWRDRDMFESRFLVKENRYFSGDENYGSSHEITEQVEQAREEGCKIVPIYALVHSDVAFSTTPYSDPWDSAQCGVMIYPESYTQEEALKAAENECHIHNDCESYAVVIEHPVGWDAVTDDSLSDILAESETQAVEYALDYGLDLNETEKAEIRDYFGIEAPEQSKKSSRSR